MTYELDDYSKDLLKLANETYPKKAKSMILKQGTKFKIQVQKRAATDVNTNSGDYKKGFKRGKHYKFDGVDAVRVYSSDRKAHWMEHGREIVDRNGTSHGFVPGKHVLEKTAKAFEENFEKACGEFLDQLLDEGF